MLSEIKQCSSCVNTHCVVCPPACHESICIKNTTVDFCYFPRHRCSICKLVSKAPVCVINKHTQMKTNCQGTNVTECTYRTRDKKKCKVKSVKGVVETFSCWINFVESFQFDIFLIEALGHIHRNNFKF